MEIELSTVLLRGATLPQTDVDAVLENVTWLNVKGAPVTVEADARLSLGSLLNVLTMKILKETLQGATVQLTRQDHDWTLAMVVGGGTPVKGNFEL